MRLPLSTALQALLQEACCAHAKLCEAGQCVRQGCGMSCISLKSSMHGRCLQSGQIGA